jgi:hypothetical protein
MRGRNYLFNTKALILRHLTIATITPLLIAMQCESDTELPIPEKGRVKVTYEVEGLDDSFYKKYEAYTYFDTTSDADNLSVLYTPSEGDNIDLSFFTEEAYQPGIYLDSISSTGISFFGTARFDQIFTVADSARLELKAIDNSHMLSSVRIVVLAGRKSYLITAENIQATSREYLLID